MVIYELNIARNLKPFSMNYSHRVEIHLKANNKQAFDYFDKKINELLSDEHFLDYLQKDNEDETKEEMEM